jgi:hypothetical protein
MPGVTSITLGGEFLMTFAWTKPLPIDQKNSGTYWARFHWQVFEGFRWTELPLSGYKKGTWDASPVFGATEPVLSAGVTGYKVSSSLD